MDSPSQDKNDLVTTNDEELLDHFLTLYRQGLLHIVRGHKRTKEACQSSCVRFWEEKSKYQQTQMDLEVKKEDFRKRMEVVASQWKDLHAEEDQLKTYKEKCAKTVKEHDEVRIQAQKKAREEREQRMQMETELLRAKREMEDLRNEHQKLCNKVQKYSIFKKYLDDVVENSEFEVIKAIIERYEMLVRIPNDVWQSQQSRKEMYEQAMVLQDQYRAEKEAEILHYKNELAELQLQFDQVQSDVRLWETRWADMQNMAAKKNLELMTIKLAILNLYHRAGKKQKGNLNLSVDENFRLLDKIQNFIYDLKVNPMGVKMKNMKNIKTHHLASFHPPAENDPVQCPQCDARAKENATVKASIAKARAIPEAVGVIQCSALGLGLLRSISPPQRQQLPVPGLDLRAFAPQLGLTMSICQSVHHTQHVPYSSTRRPS
ncbi:coiled-coil domain-containing protein 42 [Podargus strigoides]